jgi:predicted amidohydrolase
MSEFPVVAVQTEIGPPETALARAHSLLIEAVGQGAELIAFPENFLQPWDGKTLNPDQVQTTRGLFVESLQEWAVESDAWILAGSLFLKSGKNVTNSSLLITPDGEIAARYDKIHLFDAQLENGNIYEESAQIQAGRKAVTAETPWGRVGLSICYDLRFPELYRELASQGAEVIFAPSSFTARTGAAHWDVLTRARAIENQCYVVAPATWSPRTYGHTRIVDPWGQVRAERPAGAGIVRVPLDLEKLRELRKSMPVLEHRRLK